MGNKDSKNLDIDQFLEVAGSLTTGSGTPRSSKRKKSSTEALADCLASLSDMANTGVDPSTSQDIPGKTHSKRFTPRTVRRVSTKLKQKLQAQTSSVKKDTPPSDSDDLDGMLQNLSIQDGNDDNDEWASMRSWMVWCMRNNLGGIEDEPNDLPVVPSHNTRGRRLSRQAAVFVDQAPRTSRRLSHQAAFDVDREGKMNTQSSVESNAET